MEFTISELEEKTGLNRRTIHFYVKEGVISPPSGMGGAARYGEEHLFRLLLIHEMQKSHLKLSGVRETLDQMTLEQMKDIALNMSPPSIARNKQLFESWLADELQSGKMKDMKKESASPSAKAWNFSFLDIAKGMASTSTERTGSINHRSVISQRKIPAKGGIWERIEIAEGVEVHLRSDLASKYRHMIVELADRIRNKS